MVSTKSANQADSSMTLVPVLGLKTVFRISNFSLFNRSSAHLELL